MESSTILLLVLLVSVLVGFGVSVLIVRHGRTRAVAALAEVPGTVRRTTAATSIGQESLGEKQRDHTGTLELTDEELAFAQWRPERLVRIPRSGIRVVDTTRTHLDRSMKSDLLRVRWAVDGDEDCVAFFVRDLDPWLTDLGGTRTPPEEG